MSIDRGDEAPGARIDLGMVVVRDPRVPRVEAVGEGLRADREGVGVDPERAGRGDGENGIAEGHALVHVGSADGGGDAREKGSRRRGAEALAQHAPRGELGVAEGVFEGARTHARAAAAEGPRDEGAVGVEEVRDRRRRRRVPPARDVPRVEPRGDRAGDAGGLTPVLADDLAGHRHELIELRTPRRLAPHAHLLKPADRLGHQRKDRRAAEARGRGWIVGRHGHRRDGFAHEGRVRDGNVIATPRRVENLRTRRAVASTAKARPAAEGPSCGLSTRMRRRCCWGCLLLDPVDAIVCEAPLVEVTRAEGRPADR